MDRRIKSALEIMEREPDQLLLVSQIATRLRLSKSRFEHLYKEEVGQAFKKSLEELRLRKAKEMLTDPTLRIKEVAAAVGYTCARNFTRHFTKRYGKPPSRSRLSNQ
jgi:transcriptional regulator GlxA family with amidase domain